jgi:hypothetical protein
MDQAIQNCIRQGPVSNKVMPALRGQLAGPVGVAINLVVHFKCPFLAGSQTGTWESDKPQYQRPGPGKGIAGEVLSAGGKIRLSAKSPIVSARERPEFIFTAPIFLDRVNLLVSETIAIRAIFPGICQYFDKMAVT